MLHTRMDAKHTKKRKCWQIREERGEACHKDRGKGGIYVNDHNKTITCNYTHDDVYFSSYSTSWQLGFDEH